MTNPCASTGDALMIDLDDVDTEWNAFYSQHWNDESQEWRVQANKVRNDAYAKARDIIETGKLIRWTFEKVDAYENLELIDFHWITDQGTIITTLDLFSLHPCDATLLERILRGGNITDILRERLLASVQDR